MGAEAACTARFKGKTASGKARLETEVLQFRGGDLRLSIPFNQMSRITARAGISVSTRPSQLLHGCPADQRDGPS